MITGKRGGGIPELADKGQSQTAHWVAGHGDVASGGEGEGLVAEVRRAEAAQNLSTQRALCVRGERGMKESGLGTCDRVGIRVCVMRAL